MKAKTILFLIGILLIGFVIGMLTSGQIRNQKLKPVRTFFTADRFREGMYNIIQPTEEQKAEIDQIIDKYEKLNHDLQSDFRRDFETNMKAFRKELDSKLTSDQVARLKEIDEKRQEMFREGMRNRQEDSAGRRFDRRYDGRFRGGPPPFDRDSMRSDSSRRY
jgi:gas vesicle protein